MRGAIIVLLSISLVACKGKSSDESAQVDEPAGDQSAGEQPADEQPAADMPADRPAAPSSIDLSEFALPSPPELTATLNVEVTETGAIVRGPGGSEKQAADLDQLGAILDQLAKADETNPNRTGVWLQGDTASYQHIISVMDVLIAHGYRNVAIGSGTDPDDTAATPSAVDDLTKAAVLVVTPTEAKLGDVVIPLTALDQRGKELGDALAKHTPKGTLIIQADKLLRTSYLHKLLAIASDAQYDDIRFAVSRK